MDNSNNAADISSDIRAAFNTHFHINGTLNQLPKVKEHLTSAQQKVLAEAQAYGASFWLENYIPSEAVCRLEIASRAKSLSEERSQQQIGEILSAYVNKLLKAGIEPSPEVMAQMLDADRFALQQKVNRFQPQVQKAIASQVQQDEQQAQGKDPKPSQLPNIESTQSIEFNEQPLVSKSTGQEKSRQLEEVLGKIDRGLKARQFQGNFPLKVKIGSATVFEAISGKKPVVNEINPEQITLLQKALEEPKRIQGAVRISIGNETVFHVKDGNLKVDKLGLSIEQSQSPQSSQQSNQAAIRHPQASQPQLTQNQPVGARSVPPTPPSLEQQIAALHTLVERQQQQLDEMNQKLERFMNSPTVVVVGNDQLKNWFDNLHSKIQSAGQQVLAQTSKQLEQNQATLVSKVQQLWAGAKEAVADKIHATRNAIQAKASDIALDAVNATAKLASSIGEKLPDGTVVLESRNRNQRLDMNSHGVSLQQRSQLDPQALWNKFSQGIQDIQPERPVQYSLAVARNAIRNGLTRASVEDLLVADPQYQKILTEQGHSQAQKYAQQTARSAERREQLPEQQSQQQLHRSQNHGLQR